MIRKATPKDIDTIMDIWLDTNIKAHSFVTEEYWYQNCNNVRIAISEAEVYVFEDGVIKGFIGMVENYIAGIFVKEEYQGQGIGSELIQFVQGIKPELALAVYEKNERAVRFYKKHGFLILNRKAEEETNQLEYQMGWREL